MKTYKLSLFSGALTFILFASTPYILDLIAPAKSLGQIVGENTKDLIDAMQGKEISQRSNSKRDLWLNILRMTSFVLFAATLYLSINAFQHDKKLIGIGSGMIALAGLGVYFAQLTAGIIIALIVVVLAVIIYLYLES